jgi:hypothetical protein
MLRASDEFDEHALFQSHEHGAKLTTAHHEFFVVAEDVVMRTLQPLHDVDGVIDGTRLPEHVPKVPHAVFGGYTLVVPGDETFLHVS